MASPIVMEYQPFHARRAPEMADPCQGAPKKTIWPLPSRLARAVEKKTAAFRTTPLRTRTEGGARPPKVPDVQRPAIDNDQGKSRSACLKNPPGHTSTKTPPGPLRDPPSRRLVPSPNPRTLLHHRQPSAQRIAAEFANETNPTTGRHPKMLSPKVGFPLPPFSPAPERSHNNEPIPIARSSRLDWEQVEINSAAEFESVFFFSSSHQ